MSTTLLTAALIGSALFQGAEPQAAETKKEAATAEAPMEQGKPAPAAETDKPAEQKNEKPPESDATKDDSNSVERPTQGADGTKTRVGAFWFISIGK